jgi:hypothetical protein
MYISERYTWAIHLTYIWLADASDIAHIPGPVVSRTVACMQFCVDADARGNYAPCSTVRMVRISEGVSL